MTEEQPHVPRNLLARYHAALIGSLSESELAKVRVKLGGGLLEPFIEGLGDQPLDGAELKSRLEAYLREDLQMAPRVSVTMAGPEVEVEVSGCHLCHGNDLLRSQGKLPCCPFAPGINRALSRALQGGSRLEGVSKPTGVTGECVIKYTTGG